MLVTITGKPGTGKTMLLTTLAYKEFKKNNPPLKVWFLTKILKKDYVYRVNVYSDFPIILKVPKKDKIYKYYDENNNIIESPFLTSLRFRIFDLTLDKKFVDNAKFFIDEIQAKYDSMEYKDFPDSIAHYCQAHRHFNNDIYITSQSQSRIIKRLLVLSEEYWDIRTFTKILGFGISTIRVTWDLSASLENSMSNLNVDSDSFRRIVRLKKIGKMYDSCYLRYLNKDSLPYTSCMYDSLNMNKDEIMHSFFPTDEEREALKKKRY